MTDEELAQSENRNKQRKELKSAATPGPWMYESFGCAMVPSCVPKDKRTIIIVRLESWFDDLYETCGDGILDKGTTNSLQPYYDAEYIAESRSDQTEEDIDALLEEVRWLRQAYRS